MIWKTLHFTLSIVFRVKVYWEKNLRIRVIILLMTSISLEQIKQFRYVSTLSIQMFIDSISLISCLLVYWHLICSVN